MKYRLYKIATTEKKMVYTTEVWQRGSDMFEIEEMWRWGSAVIRIDDGEPFDIEEVKQNKNGFVLDDCWVEDRELDDGCSLDFVSTSTEELREEIEQLWDEGSYSSLEAAGFDCNDTGCIFYGELSVELVGEDND
jgi:hypothetical protein